jgi:NAD(P)-dependent dehydrogenase (short-subunit alcohol dehydrogenase family)
VAKSINDPPVLFVTGCSTGFGREFVRAALAHGFRVVATALEVYREVRDPRDGLKGNGPRGRGRRWGQSWLGWTRVSGGCSVAPS